MSISGISNSQNLYRNYQQLSSGKQINSAADDAAGLAIAEKLESQRTSLDVATDNAGSFQDMTKVAEGALSSVTDNLQRIRELSVQASNGLYTDLDKQAIQDEIDQLKQSISDTAEQTQFNTKKLLDGSEGPMHAAVNADGGGMDVQMPVSTLDALGIEDYDVTKDFDITAIDEALDKVSSARSKLGAASNALDHVMAYNSNTSLNTMASQSRLEDLDYGKAVSDQKKEEVLQEYTLLMQRKKIEDENGKVERLLTRP